MPTRKLWARVTNEEVSVVGTPPVVLAVQPKRHFRVETPEDILQWEWDVQRYFGLHLSGGKPGAYSYSCCIVDDWPVTDDCDLM
jgi:hypothetical protein